MSRINVGWILTGWVLLGCLLLGACASETRDESAKASREPAATALRFDGLEGAHRPVSSVTEAQDMFDQGLMWAFGFNHDEAARSFTAAARLDPDCAMAWWGLAYVLGPNINSPLQDEAQARRANTAALTALSMIDRTSGADRALIKAMSLRYQDPVPADRMALDLAYAAAMREVWREHPNDADVGVLFADAMLNLRPWDQWTPEGRPQPGTPELVKTLEDVLAFAPNHPLACHLYIHAIEASPHPEKALPVARRLDGLVPGAGHLLHMPGHIYVRLGMWDEAIRCNIPAVEADRAYCKKVGPQGIYEFYKCHNHHFIVYAALYRGDRETAMKAAREMVSEIPASSMAKLPQAADCYLPQPLHVMIRFGEWEAILKEPAYEGPFPIAKATWHYARGVALANLDRFEEARHERRALAVAAGAIPEESKIVGTPARPVFEVAKKMLDGEILFRSGEHEAGLAALRKAIEHEDALPYDEPEGWMQPVRHALGALLLQLGRHEEAEKAYREDLAKHPNNGWALHGLAECRRLSGDEQGAAETERAFRLAWAGADTEIAASCFCRRK